MKRPPRAITVQDVLQAFKNAGGKGALPDEVAVQRLTNYLNDPERESFPAHWSPRKMYELQKGNKRSAKLYRSLLLVANLAIEEAELHRKALVLYTGYMEKYGTLLIPPELCAECAERIETMLSAARAALCALQILPRYRSPGSAIWHDFLPTLMHLIKKAYEVGGRRQVSFSKPTAPAIAVLVWALKQRGYHVEPDAVVKALRRKGDKSIASKMSDFGVE